MPKSINNIHTVKSNVQEQELKNIQYVNKLGINIQAAENAEYVESLTNSLEIPENVQRLQRMMKPIDLTLPERPAELWEYAANELNLAISHTAKAGFALLMLKEMTPPARTSTRATVLPVIAFSSVI